MTQVELLSEVKTLGLRLSIVGDKLRVEGPKGKVTPELRDELALHKVEIIVALKADDVVMIFTTEYQRLANRISRLMNSDLDRGYLTWTRQHAPELWRSMELSRDAWDTNERLESLKAGRIAWLTYRKLMLAWGKLHVRAIRRHRDGATRRDSVTARRNQTTFLERAEHGKSKRT